MRMNENPTPTVEAAETETSEPDLGAAIVIQESGAGQNEAGSRPGAERARRIQRMFGAIAPTYDLNNHLLSLNIDKRWRTAAVRMGLEGRAETTRRVLDCCTGTGDLAFAFADRLGEDARVVGADFTPEMLELAHKKNESRRPSGAIGFGRVRDAAAENPRFLVGDTMNLPFADDSFDLASVAFGIRNVATPINGLREMLRVVRPGGRVLVLEFSPLRSRLLHWTYRFYFTRILPFLGGLISGRRDAYRYLAESVKAFPDCEELKSWMEEAGARNVRYRRVSLGIAAIHVGEKPE